MKIFKNNKKTKFIILGTLGATILVSAIVIPVFVINKKDNKIIEKPVVIYANKLKALPEKLLKIVDSDTITNKKAEILKELKSLKNFPKLPPNITLEVKEDSTKILNNKWTDITLIVKQKGETSIEVKGFKVISVENQKIVDFLKKRYLQKFLKQQKFNKNFKFLKISNDSGSITENKENILNKLKEKLPNDVFSYFGATIDVKNDQSKITKEGIPLVVQFKKDLAISEIDGANDSFQFFVKRTLTKSESVSEIKTYLSLVNNKLFVSNSALTSTGEEILTAVKKAMNDNVSKETKNLFTIKAGQTTLLSEGQAVSIDYGIESESFTLSIIKRTSDAQAIIDYFNQANKKDLFIPYTTTILDKASLTNAIQETLKLDDPALFDGPKKTYVTLAEDYVYNPFTKGVAQNIKVKIQKGSEEAEFITLSVTHLQKDNFKIINDYFSVVKNKKIFISHLTATSSALEILTAVKNAIGNNLDGEQKALITLENVDSLEEGRETSIIFGLTGGNEVTLLVTKRTSDTQSIIDYFAQNGNKELSIPGSVTIANKGDLNILVQNALNKANNVMFDDFRKTYVEIARDYVYSPFVKGIAKDVKVKIQKPFETPEFITLLVTHLNS